MASIVTNEGTYRGKPTAWAVGQTKNGFPQFVVSLVGAEWFNPDTQEWTPWEEYDEGITAYLCMFGKDGKPLKNVTQIMKVFGWDGASFDSLEDGDYSDLVLQFRCAEEEYEGVTRMKTQWIDVADATPGSGVGAVDKMDAAERTAMNKKYMKQLKTLSGGKVAVAKPPATKPATKKTEKKKKAAPKRRTPPKVEIEYTYQSAWDAVLAATPDADEDERVDAWSAMLTATVGDKDEDAVTSEEWGIIVKNTIKELATH